MTNNVSSLRFMMFLFSDTLSMTFIFFIIVASQKSFYDIKTTFYDKNKMS
jgi:hypothetical protein